jgi:nitroimidazol reductase NimA-like FMN-containing flavoprotein (pyridoxamine 5'-phosphate oxidase superfamily)
MTETTTGSKPGAGGPSAKAGAKPPSPRTRVRRRTARGAYDRETIHAILDEGLVAHVGFTTPDGQPFVMPMLYGRDGDTLFLHGSPASRMLGALREGVPVCVTVTLLDGIVFARSAFHHSMNYRSVVVLGEAHAVEDEPAKRAALDAVVEHVLPERTHDARGPNAKELRATLVLALPLDEASAKARTGPPADVAADMKLPVWAGEVPLELVASEPVPDPAAPKDLPVPKHVAAYRRPFDARAG